MARELNSTDIIVLALLEQRKERRKEKQRCNRSKRKADISTKETHQLLFQRRSRQKQIIMYKERYKNERIQ